jgi:Eukaryotic aspartyl protease
MPISLGRVILGMQLCLLLRNEDSDALSEQTLILLGIYFSHCRSLFTMMHPLLSFFLLTSFVSSLQVSVLRAQDATLLKRNDNEQQGLLPLQRQAVKPSSRRFSKRAGRKVNLIQADGNQEFVAQVTFGISSTTLQTFQLPVDTASSDTWVAGDNFVCEEYENYCDLGPLYTPSASFVPLNATLSDQYGDGRILGQFGTDTVTIAGISRRICSNIDATHAA